MTRIGDQELETLRRRCRQRGRPISVRTDMLASIIDELMTYRRGSGSTVEPRRGPNGPLQTGSVVVRRPADTKLSSRPEMGRRLRV